MLDLESLPRQKRLMHHQLKHTQHIPVDVTEIAHDEEFFQMQLLRAISIASAAAGFVGVDPAALESFRALTEECVCYSLEATELHRTTEIKLTDALQIC